MEASDVHPNPAQQGTKVHPADVDDPKVEPSTRKAVHAALATFWSQNLAAPQFFRKLHIARDGGFSQVAHLFTWSRFLWAAVTIGSILINISFILWPNITNLVEHDWIIDKTDRLTILNRIILGWMNKELRSEIYIAIIELVLILLLLLRALFYLGVALWTLSADQMYAWHSIAHFFFDLVPELGTFSAMRLLNFVTPTIFIPMLNVQVLDAIARKGRMLGFPLLLFLVKRALAGIVGFDAFLVKFNATAKYTEPGVGLWDAFIGCLAFVNQMLGVVQVSTFVRWRLLIYIFGGQDGFVNKREHLRQETWHAMLARRIWMESKRHKLSFVWFCVVMLSYSDYDFQALTLNENAISQDVEDQRKGRKPDPSAAGCSPGEVVAENL